jgi:hypothetical protein
MWDAIPPELLNLPLRPGGMTYLGEVAKKGDIEALHALRDRGAEVNGTDLATRTPLMIATQANQKDAVETLLKLGANVEAVDVNGRTALVYALYYGWCDVARLLIDRGRARADKVDTSKRTALDYARHSVPGKKIKEAEKLAIKAGAAAAVGSSPVRLTSYDDDYNVYESLRHHGYWWDTICSSWFLSITFLILTIIIKLWIDDSNLSLLLISFISYYLIQTTVYAFLFGLRGALTFVDTDGGRQQENNAQPPNKEESEEDAVNAWQAALEGSGSDARALSRLLKLGGPLIYSKYRVEVESLQGYVRYIRLILMAAVAIASCVVAIVSTLLLSHSRNFILSLPLNAVLLVTLFQYFRSLTMNLYKRRYDSRKRIRIERMTLVYNKVAAGERHARRPLVLYLRSFEQDGKITIGGLKFETALASVLEHYADTAAFDGLDRFEGKVIRLTGKKWLEKVAELTSIASLIIMVPGITEGVCKEIRYLRDNNLLEKTLFLVPPSDKVREEWEQVRQLEEWQLERGQSIPPYAPEGFIFTLNNKGRLKSWDALGLELQPPPLEPPPLNFEDFESRRSNKGVSLSPSIPDGEVSSSPPIRPLGDGDVRSPTYSPSADPGASFDSGFGGIGGSGV